MTALPPIEPVPTSTPGPRRQRLSPAFLLKHGLQRGSRVIQLPPGLTHRRHPGVGSRRGLGPVLGRIGSLEVRLATTRKDVKKAQRLRYRVFYEEMSAIPDMMSRFMRRDVDGFDGICDHLLVIDHDAPARFLGSGKRGKAKVVGTYRLLRQEVAERHSGFYTQGEFDIAPLLRANPGLRFLELGRSCVLEPYRDKRTVELLWHGIWAYVLHHRVDVMFGCASLAGTDPDALATQLSFLHHHARAPEAWRAAAQPRRAVAMDRLPAEAVDGKLALRQLPPLLKGYLRVGATFGDGAVVDHQFGTTDVLVVLPVSAINKRYITHFGVDASRHAA
jgi:L-ornithine Nalpha-acyltransferase